MKHNVLGVLVDATDYAGATGAVIAAATERRPFALNHLPHVLGPQRRRFVKEHFGARGR